MGANLEIAVTGMDQALAKVGILAETNMAEIADFIGALGVSQTQRRIKSEKTAPDGSAWAANHRGGSILFLRGALASSIYHTANEAGATWGSGLVYAAIHNFGGVIKPKKGKALKFGLNAKQDQHIVASVTMPKRQYLGLSPANSKEMEEMIVQVFKGRLQ